IEAPRRDFLAPPDLLDLIRLHVVERQDGLEAPVAGDQQMPIGAPLRMSDVDSPRCNFAYLAAAAVDNPQVTSHDPAVTAERLDHRDMTAGWCAARPAELILGRVEVAACPSLPDEGQTGGIPKPLARPRRYDGRNGLVAAPSGLPDVAVDSTELADAILFEVIDPRAPPAVCLLPRIDSR